MDTTYNGWANYATWRVKLELFDDTGLFEDRRYESISDLMDDLKEMAVEAINHGQDDSKPASLAVQYALAFLDDVDWREIANHIAEDLPAIMKS